MISTDLRLENRNTSGVRSALYARVSTQNGQDPEMQLLELREYATRRGWSVAGEYVDTGISGAKDSRPELNRLMADAHKRRFDVVCVWKFDRFARSTSHLLRHWKLFGPQASSSVRFPNSWTRHARRQDGIHRAGSRRRARTVVDCRAGSRRSTRRASERARG